MPLGSLAGSGLASNILRVLPSSVDQAPGAGLQPRISGSICRQDLAQSMRAFSGPQRPSYVAFEFVLLDARRLAGLHQIDGFEHRLDAHRKQPVEVDGAERVGRADRRLLLDQHVAGIEAVVRPEDRQAGFLFAEDDRPVDRRGAAIGRQQRGVILDRAVGRDVEEVLRHEQRDERHHLQVGLQRLELLPHFGLAVRRRLKHRQLGGERRLLERIGLGALFLGRDVDADDVLAALDAALRAPPCRTPAGREPRYAFSNSSPLLGCHAREGGHPVPHAVARIPAFAGTTTLLIVTPPRPWRASPAR